MTSILKVALTELSATPPSIPLTVGREDEGIDIEQFAAGKHVILCTVGTHHDLFFQPSFFENAVKMFDGKRLSIYQGHADSEICSFMLPEPMEIGFITNLSFQDNQLIGDKYYTDVTALNNYKSGSEEALSIYWDATTDIESILSSGEVNGTNAILLSVARTKNPADKATIIPEVMLSKSVYDAINKRKLEVSDTMTDTKPIETPVVEPAQDISTIIADKEKIAMELAAIKNEFEDQKTKYQTLSNEFDMFKKKKDMETAASKRNEKLNILKKLSKEKMGKNLSSDDIKKYTTCSDEVIDEKILTLSEFTGVAFGGKVPTNVPMIPTKIARGSNIELANSLKE